MLAPLATAFLLAALLVAAGAITLTLRMASDKIGAALAGRSLVAAPPVAVRQVPVRVSQRYGAPVRRPLVAVARRAAA